MEIVNVLKQQGGNGSLTAWPLGALWEMQSPALQDKRNPSSRGFSLTTTPRRFFPRQEPHGIRSEAECWKSATPKSILDRRKQKPARRYSDSNHENDRSSQNDYFWFLKIILKANGSAGVGRNIKHHVSPLGAQKPVTKGMQYLFPVSQSKSVQSKRVPPLRTLQQPVTVAEELRSFCKALHGSSTARKEGRKDKNRYPALTNFVRQLVRHGRLRLPQSKRTARKRQEKELAAKEKLALNRLAYFCSCQRPPLPIPMQGLGEARL